MVHVACAWYMVHGGQTVVVIDLFYLEEPGLSYYLMSVVSSA